MIDPGKLAGVLELLAQALRSMPAGGAAGQALAQTEPSKTVADWLDVHLREMEVGRGYREQTLRNKRSLIAHCRRLWGARPLAELRPPEIVAGLRTFPPRQGSTAHRVMRELSDAYAEAIAAGWCRDNPAANLKPPKHTVQRKRLTLEVWQQMRALAKASGQTWLENLLLLALVTGQRRGDLVKMRFDDVVDGALRVEQQKEAGKGYGFRVAIPLGLRLDAIGMTVGEGIEQCRASGDPGPTMIRKTGGGRLEVSSLSNAFASCFAAVMGSADPGPRLRPSLHEVRSLSARLYKQQGIDVQTLLGHKDAEVTAMYVDDRGLTAHEWKRVALPAGA